LEQSALFIPLSSLDGAFPWLITIGNNCRITVNVIILYHDASTMACLGYTKIGKVEIGDNVFIGSGTVILPNSHIGNNVVIGAGSVVSGDIPDNSVAVGTPAKVVQSIDEFTSLHRNKIEKGSCFTKLGFTINNGITEENKRIMKNKVKNKIAYIRVN